MHNVGSVGKYEVNPLRKQDMFTSAVWAGDTSDIVSLTIQETVS